MSENTKKNDSQKLNEPVDLSALIGVTFGPSWSDSRVKPEKAQQNREEAKSLDSRQEKRRFEKRDRRPARNKRLERPVVEFFQPIVNVSFYPEDEPFLALIKALKASCKTYELFELAHLILEKVERFVVVVSPKRTKDNVLPKLYFSPIDGIPFEKEELAISYSLKNHLDKFFEIEEVEIERPKGSFPVINRCGFTGVLIGPPNYHRYQDLLKEHYENNLSHIPYERFLSKIESVRDAELVKAWEDKMAKSKRYILKTEAKDDEKPVLNTWEEARSFLIVNRKKDLVRESSSIRIHGTSLDNFPKGDILRSIETAFKAQQDFPLDTANNLRGRLRRMNLTIYKKGLKGVTYVCAVKRKFCQPGITFTDNLQKLIEFIQKHPNCLASKLPELYLGIPQGGAKANNEAKEEEIVEESIVKTPEQQGQIRQLMLDLRWLVSEGYVTEYGNGALFADTSAEAIVEERDEKVQEETEASEKMIQETVQEPLESIKKKATKRTKKAIEKAEDEVEINKPTEVA